MATSQLIKSQRKELDATDAENLRRIAEAYAIMWDRLEGDVNALMLAIEDLDEPSSAEIKALPEYKRFVERMERELDRFTVYLETVIGAAGLAAIGLGLTHSEALILDAGVTFTGLESASVAKLLNYLSEDGALYARLKLITNSTVDKVVEAIIEGVSSGFNPRKIASLIQDAFGGGLTDALRNVRTVQLYAYRDAARANYMASDGVVTKWIWWAELDEDVCMSCVSMHGTLHDLDESLDDHYNGRCAAVPYIPDITQPSQTGQEWFDSLTEEQQRAMMGNSKWEAWKDNKFEFSALSTQQENEIYGKMRTETSLKDLLGE